MKCFVFSAEPAGPEYRALVDFCCSVATRMMMVVPDPRHESEATLSRLHCDFAREERAKKWPGTTLLGGEATLYFYFVTPRLQENLKSLATHLFEWVGFMPEDPCFFRADGQVLLVTTSHEGDAYLLLTEQEHHELQQTFPALASILVEEGEV